jgi:hypothetical protein
MFKNGFKLSDILDEKTKSHKIKNLVQYLRKSNKIELNKGKKWVLKLRRTYFYTL